MAAQLTTVFIFADRALFRHPNSRFTDIGISAFGRLATGRFKTQSRHQATDSLVSVNLMPSSGVPSFKTLVNENLKT